MVRDLKAIRREMSEFDLWRARRAFFFGEDHKAYSLLLDVIRREVPNGQQESSAKATSRPAAQNEEREHGTE